MITPMQQKILDALPASQAWLKYEFNLSTRALFDNLESMRTAGLIYYVGEMVHKIP